MRPERRRSPWAAVQQPSSLPGTRSGSPSIGQDRGVQSLTATSRLEHCRRRPKAELLSAIPVLPDATCRSLVSLLQCHAAVRVAVAQAVSAPCHRSCAMPRGRQAAAKGPKGPLRSALLGRRSWVCRLCAETAHLTPFQERRVVRIDALKSHRRRIWIHVPELP